MHLLAGVFASLHAYELVESNCSGRPILIRFRIVRATLGMSCGNLASDCAIEAMISASYGVRCCFFAASAKPTCRSCVRYLETMSWSTFVEVLLGSIV